MVALVCLVIALVACSCLVVVVRGTHMSDLQHHKYGGIWQCMVEVPDCNSGIGLSGDCTGGIQLSGGASAGALTWLIFNTTNMVAYCTGGMWPSGALTLPIFNTT